MVRCWLLKHILNQSLVVTAVVTGALLTSSLTFAADVPQSFTLDGRFFSDPDAKVPLADASIVVRLQILDEDKICVLYEESQTISTLASQGYFSIQVGSVTGSSKRSPADSGKAMSEVFSNLNAIAGKAIADGTPCNVLAVGGKRRFVRMLISPSSMGGAERKLSPDLTIDSVPNAVIAERAETIQGLRSSSLLQVNSSGTSVLTQSNLENLFSSPTRYNAMSSIIDGTSVSYMRSNSSAGAQLPVMAGAPTSPAAGSVWFDSSDEKLKYQTSGGPISLSTGVGATASGTSGRIAKFSGATALGDSLISDDGNQVTVAGNVVSTPGVVATGGTVNLRASNTHILNSVGSSTITLQNPAHGGLYTVVVADVAARTYTFAGCTNANYKPAKGPTTLNTQTVFGILFVDAGAGVWNCYITWSTGFQP